MKKKRIGIILSAVLICCAIGWVVYDKNKLNVQYAHANYYDQKSNFCELVSDSRLVIKGKVNQATPVEIHEVIFTDYEVMVNEIIKSEGTFANKSVTIRLSGGTLNNTQLIFEGVKQLDKDSEYIFCLKKLDKDDASSNIYRPAGVFQGVFAFEDLKNGKVKIKKFNDANKIENNIKGKELEMKKDFN